MPASVSVCTGPIVRGQHVGPLFSAKLVRWSEHPVLSKPPAIRGVIPTDGSPARVDMSVGDQLRQRAAMGGEKERVELAGFEALLSKCIADALVAEVRKEAESHGVDVLTWLTRDKRADEYPILRMVATNRAAFAHRRRQRITLAHGRRVPAPTCPSIQMYANVYTDGESNGKDGRTSAQACRERHRAP